MCHCMKTNQPTNLITSTCEAFSYNKNLQKGYETTWQVLSHSAIEHDAPTIGYNLQTPQVTRFVLEVTLQV
jgi:hypothetical protein